MSSVRGCLVNRRQLSLAAQRSQLGKRQPVKVVKLAVSLAAVVGHKKVTKMTSNYVVKILIPQHHFLCVSATKTYRIFYQQTTALSYTIHLRPSWPAMILVSAPAKRSAVNLQSPPLPLSKQNVTKQSRRKLDVVRPKTWFPTASGMYNPQMKYVEMQIWLMLLL